MQLMFNCVRQDPFSGTLVKLEVVMRFDQLIESYSSLNIIIWLVENTYSFYKSFHNFFI